LGDVGELRCQKLSDTPQGRVKNLILWITTPCSFLQPISWSPVHLILNILSLSTNHEVYVGMVEMDNKYQQNKANINVHNISEACGIQLYKKLRAVTEP
jgi:hypothetical protein